MTSRDSNNMKQIISNNFRTLRSCLKTSDDLLSKLQSVAFVKDQICLMQQKLTDDNNIALLAVLLSVPRDQQQSVKDGVITALRSCGQDHAADIFSGESDKESGKKTCHKGVTLINMIFSVALRLQHV